MSKYQKFIYAADNHGWLYCKDALKKLLDFSNTWKPKFKVHGGDLWDFSALRMGASQEDKAQGIAEDFTAGLDWLDEYSPRFLTLGNHDDRIWQQAQQRSDGVLREACEQLCQSAEREFKKRKIQWIPYHIDKFLRLPCGGPKFIHGFKSSMYPAKAHFENWGDVIHGHTHKPDMYVARHVDGGKALSAGCMADLSQFSYSNRQPARLGHRNGFVYGIIDAKGNWEAWQVIRNETTGDWISPHGLL